MKRARDRVIPLAELAQRLERERSGRTVVFTNGCFDILHAGHIRYLEDARALGDMLVLGVNSDSSTRRLKGPSRPIVPEDERAEAVAALRSVDYVTVFEEDTPVETIRILKPDIHVKGGDYRAGDLPETPVVESYGGKVVIVPFSRGLSTTSIIERIRGAV